MQKYEKYAGHEMNLFLYFKDKPFFNNVVKQYLPSKRDKMFYDHFVLEDTTYFEEMLTNNVIFDQQIDHQILAFYCLA